MSDAKVTYNSQISAEIKNITEDSSIKLEEMTSKVANFIGLKDSGKVPLKM